MNKTVCVIGMGYIGLPMAAVIAKSGHVVHGVDINAQIVQTITEGKVHIKEPGLAELVEEVTQQQSLTIAHTARKADVFIICVPTPLVSNGHTFQPDISYVLSALDTIREYVQEGNLIVLESTSPPGTTTLIQERLRESIPYANEVRIAYCPERIIPGNALHEITHIDRVVGGVNTESTNAATAFYKSFVTGKILQTNATTAELVKLSENSFRDVNIAFANELSLIAHELQVNVWELIALANHHPRVNILQPGIGVGGHCIAVDPWFLASAAPEHSRLISTARGVNKDKTKWIIENIRVLASSIKHTSPNPIIALLGLAYKANIGDLRESPALDIAHTLKTEDYNIVCVEPHIQEHSILPLDSLDSAIEQAHIIVMLVNHTQFNVPNIKQKANHALFVNYTGEAQ